MKTKISRVLSLIFACFLITMISIPGYALTDVEKAKEEQEQMEEKLKDTQQALEDLEQYKADSQAYVEKMDDYLSTVVSKIDSLNGQIDAKNAEIQVTKQQIKDAEKSINEQYEAMKLRIKFLYENGEASYISMILESKDMSDLLNRAEYLADITEYDRNMLIKLEETKKKIETEKAKLDSDLSGLNKLQAEAKAEQQSVEQIISTKTSAIANTTSEMSEKEQLIAQQEAEIDAQKKIVAELEEIERKRLEAAKNLTYDGGTLAWPVPGYSYVSSEFGYRISPINGAEEYHSGIDIPASTGTDILAAYDGEVAWSYYSSSAGNWVGIDHGNGLYTIYMHMTQRLVSEGDIVSKGEVIGLVGSTGWSTGSHLHFGIRLNGNYVSPRDYVTP